MADKPITREEILGLVARAKELSNDEVNAVMNQDFTAASNIRRGMSAILSALAHAVEVYDRALEHAVEKKYRKYRIDQAAREIAEEGKANNGA